MLTKTSIAGVDFDSYICNASGPNCSTLEELKIIGSSESSAIMMKSCTVEPRDGNPEPRYVRLPLGALQSMGLPNLGYKEYVKYSSQLMEYEKPIIASVSGLCADDYEIMVDAFLESDVDLIEVNLSCPNVVGKPQVAYDMEQTEEVLSKVTNSDKKPIGLKLPPFYDLVHHKQMAELILDFDISFISCINSIGNTLVIDAETEAPMIKPKKGFGGLSGEYIKPIALANVKAFYDLLGDKVSIFGVGGVSNGTDAFEFLLAGADCVQIATTFEKEGPESFNRINNELEQLMKMKGYNSISEVKGELREL